MNCPIFTFSASWCLKTDSWPYQRAAEDIYCAALFKVCILNTLSYSTDACGCACVAAIAVDMTWHSAFMIWGPSRCKATIVSKSTGGLLKSQAVGIGTEEWIMSKYQACLQLYPSVKYQILQVDTDVLWMFSALELVFFCVNALRLRI